MNTAWSGSEHRAGLAGNVNEGGDGISTGHRPAGPDGGAGTRRWPPPRGPGCSPQESRVTHPVAMKIPKQQLRKHPKTCRWSYGYGACLPRPTLSGEGERHCRGCVSRDNPTLTQEERQGRHCR